VKNQLVNNADFRVAMLPVAAGTTDTQKGVVLDSEGYDSITVVLLLGTVVTTAVITPALCDGTLANGSDQAPTTGATAITDAGGASSDKLIVLELYRPLNRYVQLWVTRATANITIAGAIAILHHGKAVPVTPSADILEALLLPVNQ
jgi:hypothetical protein